MRLVVWCAATGVAVACALPKAEIDPSVGAAGAAPAKAGASGTGGSGTGGGGGAGTAAHGGTDVGAAGQSGEFGADARELACGDYCQTYLQNCAGFPANDYTGLDDCLKTCFTSDWPFGADQAQVNSVQCRVTHAHLAATSQNPHCFHSARVPTGTSCAPPQ